MRHLTPGLPIFKRTMFKTTMFKTTMFKTTLFKTTLFRTTLFRTTISRMTMIALGMSLAVQSAPAQAQSLAGSVDSPGTVASATSPQPDLTYVRPTRKIKLRNYLFDAFGPYPIGGAGIVGAINQATNTPPEWKQGAGAYGQRFGSAFGIAGITTTTRYALAQAFKEDTLYYRCECTGVFPRLRHALVSTFTSRRGEDGHTVFSFPALVAPYAGTMTAVYAWYPSRYDAKDGLRMGNYSLLAYAGGNIGLEFLYSGPHSWLSRMHLNSARRGPSPGSQP
jgi:hypothetical protein